MPECMRMLYIDEIMGAVEALDIDKAMKLFDRYRFEYGNEPEFIAAQAIFYVQTQELESALDILSEGVSKHPDNTDLLYNLGYVYHSLGFGTQALEFYNRSIASTVNEELIDELKQLCAEIDADPKDEYVTELINKSRLSLIKFINGEECNLDDIIMELKNLLPLQDSSGMIIIKANGSDIYTLQREPMFKKEFAQFRPVSPKAGYLTINTSKPTVDTLSKDNLNDMDFEINSDAITPETFRLLVRRLEFGIETEKTKKALSNAFSTGRLSEEEIANILHATWIDMARINEITDLIKH